MNEILVSVYHQIFRFKILVFSSALVNLIGKPYEDVSCL